MYWRIQYEIARQSVVSTQPREILQNHDTTTKHVLLTQCLEILVRVCVSASLLVYVCVCVCVCVCVSVTMCV